MFNVLCFTQLKQYILNHPKLRERTVSVTPIAHPNPSQIQCINSKTTIGCKLKWR